MVILHQILKRQSDKCIWWPMGRDDKGYAVVCIPGGTNRKAYRVICEMVNGNPPTPKHVASHTCGNGHAGCVNPRHLEWKTNSENQRDRRRHGRQVGHPYGNKGTLTPEEIAAIQAERGRTPITTLARRYGVKRGAIDYWHKKAKLMTRNNAVISNT